MNTYYPNNNNCKDAVDPRPKIFGQWPNKSKTINLLESRLVNERSMSYNIDHSKLVGIRINKTNNLKRKILLDQVQGWYVILYFS